MTTLLFIIVILSFVFLVAKIVLQLVAGRDIVVLVRMLLGLMVGYGVLWVVFLFLRVDQPVPLGVDCCYDDWCAMVTGAEYPATLGRQERPEGQWVVLYVRLSNPASAALLKESQPRVFVLDGMGHEWSASARGQRALEASSGPQAPFVNRSGAQSSFETELVFDVPKTAKRLTVRIDNGPGILRSLLLPEGRIVVALP
ncbi:MAG TPA: hypothetical protein VGM89_03005 [Puia sp.]|jgi:hypothetical protein